MPDYSLTSWAKALLGQLGMPVTPTNITALSNWARAEGGHWKNAATFNPLNTTQKSAGAKSMNSVGVKSYGSWEEGLAATAHTLENGRYGGVLSALRSGKDPNAVWDAVLSSPWGTQSIPRGSYKDMGPAGIQGAQMAPGGPSSAVQALQQLQATPEAPPPVTSPVGLDPGEAVGIGDTGSVGLDDKGPLGMVAKDPFLPQLNRADFEKMTGIPGAGNGQFPAVNGAHGMRGNIVNTAYSFLGQPYVWGGLDCSGLVQQVFGRFGIDLPRVSYQQARAGARVGLGQLQPGDLVAWDNSTRNNGADHIAIYIGGGQIIEAPRPGLNVRVRKLGKESNAWGVRMNLEG